MINDADISENQLLHSYGEKVCMNLLKDHTTKQNIYWATDSYADYGEDFTFFAPITLDKITSYASKEGKVITKEQYNELVKKNPEEKNNYQEIIRPRAVKSKEEQTQRAKDKAEVFTPAWICNAQNNLIDEEWFGRKEGLFNSPDPENPQKWINNEEKIEFPEGKTWKDYVADTRLEITCGEAPYIVSRYDAATGELLEIRQRIGILDRKLRVVNENTDSETEWFKWVLRAYQSVYGYEFQGDSLLIARINLLITFVDYMQDRWDRVPTDAELRKIVNVIVWNLWQMDGISGTIPFGKPKEEYHQFSLFDFVVADEPRKQDIEKPEEVYCRIYDWRSDKSLTYKSMKEGR